MNDGRGRYAARTACHAAVLVLATIALLAACESRSSDSNFELLLEIQSPDCAHAIIAYDWDNGAIGESNAAWAIVPRKYDDLAISTYTLPYGWKAVGWNDAGEALVHPYAPDGYPPGKVLVDSGAPFNGVVLRVIPVPPPQRAFYWKLGGLSTTPPKCASTPPIRPGPWRSEDVSRADAPSGWCTARVVERHYQRYGGGETAVMLDFDRGRCSLDALGTVGDGRRFEIVWLDDSTLCVAIPDWFNSVLQRNDKDGAIGCGGRKVRLIVRNMKGAETPAAACAG